LLAAGIPIKTNIAKTGQLLAKLDLFQGDWPEHRGAISQIAGLARRSGLQRPIAPRSCSKSPPELA
jgi:hypothetical protein